MKKQRLYLPVKDYFIVELHSYINQEIDRIFSEICMEMQNFGPDSWNSEGFAKLIIDNLKNCATIRDKGPLEFKLDLLKNDVFYSESTLYGLIEYYPSCRPDEQLTLTIEEYAGDIYALQCYEVIEIEESEEFIELFKKLKYGLIAELIAYIKSDFYMKISEGLVKDGKVYSPIYQYWIN